jgi:hypothetical protein
MAESDRDTPKTMEIDGILGKTEGITDKIFTDSMTKMVMLVQNSLLQTGISVGPTSPNDAKQIR